MLHCWANYDSHTLEQRGNILLPTTNSDITGTKPTARSRVTNGSALLSGVDGRSIWARRMRDLIEQHTNDMGGVAACSHAERSLVRRVACLSVELEHLEARFATADGAHTARPRLVSENQ